MGKIPLTLEFVETKEHPQLVAELRRLLADSFIFYYKAHVCHWNVEGPDFGPLHTLFGDIAGEVYGAIDTLAEHLRKLNAYTPTTLTQILKSRTVVDFEINGGLPVPMLTDLSLANDAVLQQLRTVHAFATQAELSYLVNFIDERIDAHQKHGWFLRATRTV